MQRIVDVGDAQHARGARDFLARQPLGVALAVPALVVRPHHRPHLAGEIHLGEHLDARDRMALDQLPLVGRELAGLVQDI